MESISMRENSSPYAELSLVGSSQFLSRIVFLVDRVKDRDTPVFIWGESGTGKELVARYIHLSGYRKRKSFIALNCAAIPENLLESELFGYIKGAFTGAVRDKPGLIEEAAGGTLFLDEIGDLSLRLQAKILRLLQEREIRRIGENRNRMVDVRFISATNKNIDEEIIKGNFREDLFYRLNVITIEVDPLRKKREDIVLLLDYFLKKYGRQMDCEEVKISPQAMELLIDYSWPGNVRELQNEIQRCLILNGQEKIIKAEDLSSRINPAGRKVEIPTHDFFRAKADFEKKFLHLALSRYNYNRAKTAREIGLSRQGLFKLIKKHRIDVPAHLGR